MRKDPTTFLASHLNALKARAATCTTDAEGHALAASLVVEGQNGHVASATYRPELRRIEVALHPGSIHVAFPLEIGEVPKPARVVVADVAPAVTVEV